MDIKEIFVKGAWSFIVSDETKDFDNPVSDEYGNWENEEVQKIVQKMLEVGVDMADISRLAKIMQFQLLSNMCYYLEDPAISELAGQSNFLWGLFSLNEDEEPYEQLTGLHELVLINDPSGNEMRPK
jgi:hypothetical protein